MASWTLDLPDAPIVTPNSRGHWANRAACAKTWRWSVAVCARQQRVPRMDRVTVKLTMLAADRRRRDPDGLGLVVKWCIDGLRDGGVLVDDDSTRVVEVSTSIRRQPLRVSHGWLLTVTEVGVADAA